MFQCIYFYLANAKPITLMNYNLAHYKLPTYISYYWPNKMTINSIALSSIAFLLFLLSGCSTLTHKNSTADKGTLHNQSATERARQLENISQWQVRGKIAFIENKERNSANLSWKVNKGNATQQLNLTSYLGINVLKLTSEENLHTITFDGKNYYDSDLQLLIYSLTGLTLPVVALDAWLKGLPHQESDIINYNETTQLPLSLTSSYNQSLWQVKYDKYKQFGQHYLATKLSIRKSNLLIKLSINQWKIIDSLKNEK
jgi:outer membrane lipoprotein LolB